MLLQIPIPIYMPIYTGDSGPSGPWTHNDTVILWCALITMFIGQLIISGLTALIKRANFWKIFLPLEEDTFIEYVIPFFYNVLCYCLYAITLLCWIGYLIYNCFTT